MTPANLVYFLAEAVDDRWVFSWQSLREIGNLGFNLYTQTAEGWKRLNLEKIPAQKMYSDSNVSYSTEMPAGDGKLFLLEEVDGFGHVRRHGPFVLGQPFGSLAVEKPTNWQAILDEHAWKQSMREQSVRKGEASTQGSLAGLEHKIYLPVTGQRSLTSTNQGRTFVTLDLAVEDEGIYRITYDDLLAAGFDWAGVDPASVTLLNHGASVPLSVQTPPDTDEFGPGSYVEFYGQGIASLYTRENIYTLT